MITPFYANLKLLRNRVFNKKNGGKFESLKKPNKMLLYEKLSHGALSPAGMEEYKFSSGDFLL